MINCLMHNNWTKCIDCSWPWCKSWGATSISISCIYSPVLVAGDGDIVDVVGEVVRRRFRVCFVIEGPVAIWTVVLQLRVREIDPVLQGPEDFIETRVVGHRRRKAAVVVPVNTTWKGWLEALLNGSLNKNEYSFKIFVYYWDTTGVVSNWRIFVNSSLVANKILQWIQSENTSNRFAVLHNRQERKVKWICMN